MLNDNMFSVWRPLQVSKWKEALLQLCTSVGKGAAMIIESLGLYFHIQCFKVILIYFLPLHVCKKLVRPLKSLSGLF